MAGKGTRALPPRGMEMPTVRGREQGLLSNRHELGRKRSHRRPRCFPFWSNNIPLSLPPALHPPVLCYCHLEAMGPGKPMKNINQETWLLSLKQLRLNEAFQLTPFQAWLVATNPWTPDPTPDGIHHDCVMVDWKPIVRNTFSQKGEPERLGPLESNEILLDGEVDKKKKREKHVNNVEMSSPRASAKGAAPGGNLHLGYSHSGKSSEKNKKWASQHFDNWRFLETGLLGIPQTRSLCTELVSCSCYQKRR